MKSVKETSKILGVHWQTVRNMILRGEIKAVKIGRQWKITDEEIERIKKGK
jgi:excisionase family DNA binding protein